jgi:nucleotide-binding universal stress UspA family protein
VRTSTPGITVVWVALAAAGDVLMTAEARRSKACPDRVHSVHPVRGASQHHGIALANRIGAKTTVLTVLPDFHTFTTDTEMLEDTPAQYKTRMRQRAEKILGAAIHAAQAAGVACEAVHIQQEHPYRAIIDTAESKGCDLVVMASHGRHGISAIVLGSETVKVLTHSKIPVLVYR